MATLLRKAGTKTVERRGEALKKPTQPQSPAVFILELGMGTAAEVVATVRAVAEYLAQLEAPFAQAELKGPNGEHAGYFALGPVGKLRGKPVRYFAGLVCELAKMPRQDLLEVLANMADRIEERARIPGKDSVGSVLPEGRGMFWFTLE